MTNKETVEVTIDSNEASQCPELVEVFALHEDTQDWEIKPLPEGDFIIDNCIFERKTPSDFASSLQDGRLRDQVDRLAGRDMIPYIVFDGNMEDFENLSHTNISPKALRGMVSSIERHNKIPTKFCSNNKTLADVSVRLARKEKEDPSVSEARQTEAIKDVSFIEEVFLAIDGVGVKTAEKLANRFETLEAAINAAQSDFKEVDDVGDVTSETIYNTLHSVKESTTSDDSDRGKKVYKI